METLGPFRGLWGYCHDCGELNGQEGGKQHGHLGFTSLQAHIGLHLCGFQGFRASDQGLGFQGFTFQGFRVARFRV